MLYIKKLFFEKKDEMLEANDMSFTDGSATFDGTGSNTPTIKVKPEDIK